MAVEDNKERREARGEIGCVGQGGERRRVSMDRKRVGNTGQGVSGWFICWGLTLRSATYSGNRDLRLSVAWEGQGE